MPDTVSYVYGAVSLPLTDPEGGRTPRLAGAPPDGVEGAPVRVLPGRDGIAALVSTLTGEIATTVADRGGDTTWMAPRAVAHDAVVTWAADASDGSVVPFPMWVIFADDAAVQAMIGERAPELRAGLDGVAGAREYVVRVAADAAVIARDATRLEPSLGELEASAAHAPPGQAYLLRRKLSDARRQVVRDIARRVALETHDALEAQARRCARVTSTAPSVVLDAAYLVPASAYDLFREALSALVVRYGSSGFRFDFTGPWPPYHFARAD